MTLDNTEMLEVLGPIADEVGVTLWDYEVDPDQPGWEVIGSPPASATLLGDESGARAVHCPFLGSPAAVEEVLHELAHASVGLAEEWRCYELEAVWALRLPAAVSTAVAEMAFECVDLRP